MAKAGGNTNTTWILLRDARALAIEAYDGAVKKAEDLLTEWLGDGRVRWSCKLFEPASDPAALNRGADAAGLWFLTGVAYSEGDPAFWRTSLNINWEENWAHRDVRSRRQPGSRDQGGARGPACTVAAGAERVCGGGRLRCV